MLTNIESAQSADGRSIERSAWSITAFDSAPIADALPDMELVRIETRRHEMAVCHWLISLVWRLTALKQNAGSASMAVCRVVCTKTQAQVSRLGLTQPICGTYQT